MIHFRPEPLHMKGFWHSPHFTKADQFLLLSSPFFMTHRLEAYLSEEWCPQTHSIVVTSDLAQEGGSLCYHDVAVRIATSREELRQFILQAFEHANLLKVVPDLSEWEAQEMAEAITAEMNDDLFCTQKALVQKLRSLALFS